MDMNALLQVDERLVINDDDECTVLFDPQNGSVFLLNLYAAKILRHLRKPATPASLILAVRSEQGPMDAEAEKELLNVTSKLLAMNMLNRM
jgi:hypothetical protein